jgi:UDP-N-acetylmuramoyl-tripeptide--D-alanyl-D-alanine ligase
MSPGPLTLDEVQRSTAGRLRGRARPNLTLSRVAARLPSVASGTLFVPLQLRGCDGHDRVVDAFAAGAAAALIERVPPGLFADDSSGPPLILVPSNEPALRGLARHWLERSSASLVLVTGEVGRATTAELAAAVLRQRLPAGSADAPHRPDVFGPLAVLERVLPYQRFVLGLRWSQQPELERLLEIGPPRTLVLTGRSLQPGRRAGGVRAAETAAALIAVLPPTGILVVNADAPTAREQASTFAGRVISYGLGSTAEVRAESVVSHGAHGTEFELVAAGQRVHVRLPFYGSAVVHSALAAVAVGLADGLEPREAGAGLQAASATPRIVISTGLNGSRLIEDTYAASLESCLEALNLLATLDGRRIAVFGRIGDPLRRSDGVRRMVGNRAASVASFVVSVGDAGGVLAEEARSMGLAHDRVLDLETAQQAAQELRRLVSAGDVVLLKASHESELTPVVQALRVEA